MRRPLIAVIGGHYANTSHMAMALAEETGRLLAVAGYGIVCGGGDGVMEAACRGCRSAGGITVGILKFNDSAKANDHVEIAIPTSMDVASNNLIIWSAEAVLAFEGRYGTLNELALALDFGKPVIQVGKVSLLNTERVESDLYLHVPDVSVDTLPGVLERMPALIETARSRFTPRQANNWKANIQ